MISFDDTLRFELVDTIIDILSDRDDRISGGGESLDGGWIFLPYPDATLSDSIVPEETSSSSAMSGAEIRRASSTSR